MAKAPTIVAGATSSNDSYTISEDQAAGTVTFNVRLNDPAKSTLYSLDDAQSAELVTQDGVLVPQTSRLGATIMITADGQVSYSFDSPQVQALGPGQTLQDSFLYALRLQNGSLIWQTVTVTITGTNDVPVAAADVAAVAEDAVTTGSVAANDRDVDNGAVLTFATTDPIPAGFSMASNGSWAFDGANPAYQWLADGQTQQFVIEYWVTDQYGASSQSTLTLTVTGRNDAPAAASANAAVAEDATVNGQLTATDVDQASGLTFALSEAAPAGFSLSADGRWTFDASTYDSLAAGQTQTILVRYAAVDNAGARGNAVLSITITGTNDGPVASAATASVAEDATVSGTVVAFDADAGASLTYAVAGGAPDGFSMAANGSWAFDTRQPEFQALGVGQSGVVTVNYVATDDSGASSASTLTITVTGTNDGPTATAATAAVAEDGMTIGQLLVADVDAGAVLTVSQVGSQPGVTINADGSWTYDANQYFLQSLGQGQTQDIVVSYRVTDERGASAVSALTVTVTGANDAPVTTSQWFEVTENVDAIGGLMAWDQDYGAQLTYALDGEAPAGLTLINGALYFDGDDPAYDHLTYGEVQLIQVPYTVTDEFGASTSSFFTLAVTGRNDAATIGGVRTGSVTEAGAGVAGTPTAQGQLTISDPDSPATWQTVAAGTVSVGGYGSYSVSSSGAWSYTVDNSNAAVGALNAGQTLQDSFYVQSADGSSSVVTITINGANDWTNPTSNGSGWGDPNDGEEVQGGWGYPNQVIFGTAGSDSIVANDGSDRIYLGEGNDTAYGFVGGDLIMGDGGDDTLYGQAGADQLIGGLGNDILYFGSGNDIGSGSEGNDTLYGGTGWDDFSGNAGDDILIGGWGRDYTQGGAGADRFVYLDLRDTNDILEDFVFGTDRLDFSALDANAALAGDQAFAWGGTIATANGLWVTQVGTTVTIYADTDGNVQTAEFMVVLDRPAAVPLVFQMPDSIIF